MKLFSFFPIFFGLWSHFHPQPHLAKEYPLGSAPALVISVSAVGYTTLCRVKFVLLPNIIPRIAEVTTMEFGHIQPFLPGLRG